MLKFMGKFIGQMIPPIMATIIGAYLVQQIFPGRFGQTAAPPAPASAVATPTPTSTSTQAPSAPVNNLAKNLAGPPAEPTEIVLPNKATPANKESIREAKEAVPVPPSAPRRVAAPAVTAPAPRERAEAPAVRDESGLPPLELAAKVLASLPPSKTSTPARDLPETRDGALPPPVVPSAGQSVSVMPLPPPPAATNGPSNGPMPILPPSAAAPLPPPDASRALAKSDPLQVTESERAGLAAIPTPGPEEAEPRRPSLFERGGALVKGVVTSVTSVLPGRN